jgi:ABC-type uncharacterized transport system substrate-binding protein
MSVGSSVKRVLPGIILIAAVAVLLLISDLNNRDFAEEEESDMLNAPKPGKVYKIGIGYFGPDEGTDNVIRGIFDGLEDLGFKKGENLEATIKHANGEIANIPMMFQSLDNEDFDVITPLSTPCLMGALTTVKRNPIVFTYCYDPIAAGAGKSYEEHLPNVTGVGSFPPIEETMEFIEEIVPGIKKIGTIYNSSEANSRKAISEARKILKKEGIKLEAMPITTTNEVVQAMQILASENIGAIWVTGDNTVLQAVDAVVSTAIKNRLPLVLNDKEFVDNGAMAAVGLGWYATGRRAAKMIARVMLGESPADIPMDNYVETRLEVNREVAEKIGIELPESIEQKLAEQNKANSKTTKITVCEYTESSNSEACVQGIKDGFEKLGYKNGENIDIEVKIAQGDMATLTSIVHTVASQDNDIIMALSTPTLQAFVKNTKETPVVFTNVADPVAAGAGESFDNHLPNFTGISTMSDFDGMVEFLRKFMPDAKKIGTLYTPTEINSVIYKDKLKKAAEKAGYEFVELAVYQSSDISNAADVLCSKDIDAFCQISDNLNNAAIASIASATEKSSVPLFTFISNPVKKSMAIACVARDYYQCGIDAAKLAVDVLNGANPAKIPFTYASSTKIFINKKMAEEFGIELTPEKKELAGEIIGG